MASCLFCNIANQTNPADIVYEDDEIIAFNDIAPQAPTHILVIPKEHIESSNYFDASNQLLIGRLMTVASTIAKEQNLAEDGYRFVMNCNRNGGQTVFHTHLHLLGGRRLKWPPG